MKTRLSLGVILITVIAVSIIWHRKDDSNAPQRSARENTASHKVVSSTRKETDHRKKYTPNDFKKLAVALARQNPKREVETEGAPLPGNADDDMRFYRAQRDYAIREIYWDELINTVDNIHQNDEHDEARTRAAEDALDRIIELDKSYDSRVDNVDCSVKLCKIVTIHKTKEEYDRFGDGPVMVAPLWASGSKSGNFKEMENGEIKATFYFSRNDNGKVLEEEISEAMYSMVLAQGNQSHPPQPGNS